MSLLTSKISYGLVDGRPVFMDLAEDNYFRLEPAEEAEFAAQMDDAGDHQAIVPWIGAPITALEYAQCPRPGITLLDAIHARRTNLADVARVAMLVGAARRALARRPIAQILSGFGSRVDGKGESASERQALAVRFLAARRLVPVKPNCLLDSLALLRWLAASAEGLLLVFGVKLDPFGAHCWIQSETMLINDRPDTVARFAPVRVVECRAPTR